MNGFLLDTNVLLDIATADATWLAWSEGQFRAAAAQGPILINPIVDAENAPAFATQSGLDRWLDPAVFQRLPPTRRAHRSLSGKEKGGPSWRTNPDTRNGVRPGVFSLSRFRPIWSLATYPIPSPQSRTRMPPTCSGDRYVLRYRATLSPPRARMPPTCSGDRYVPR